MLNCVFRMLLAVASLAVFPASLPAQTSRASVSAAEVNGTFRSYFKGKFKGSFNEIKILSVGRGKIKIAMDLIYPYVYGKGEMMANMGQLEGVADISGDTAVYTSEEFGACRITIKFVKPGTISVEQDAGSECGFGHGRRKLYPLKRSKAKIRVAPVNFVKVIK